MRSLAFLGIGCVVVAWTLVATLGFAASAGAEVQRWVTRDGVALSLPDGYELSPASLPRQQLPADVELEREFVHASNHVVRGYVWRSPALATQQLEVGAIQGKDAGKPKLVDAFVHGIARSLGEGTVHVQGSGYDPQRALLWATFTQRAASGARDFLDRDARAAALAPGSAAQLSQDADSCILAPLLGPDNAVTIDVLRAREDFAASRCGLSVAAVRAYTAEVGTEFFAPVEIVYSSFSFLTRSALVTVLVAATQQNASAQQAAAQHLMASARVEGSALP